MEVIVRNVGAGSFAKRMGIEEGRTLKCPTVEFSYKNDALGDPFINHWYALALNLATEEEIEKLRRLLLRSMRCCEISLRPQALS